MAYAGLGERTALFRAGNQLGANSDELRQAHRLIMETTRYQNQLEYLLAFYSKIRLEDMPHGVSSFLRILAFLKCVDFAKEEELRRVISFARQILGWKELHPHEITIGRIITEKQSIQPRDEYEKISLETCHPVWYVQCVLSTFERDFGLKILRRDMNAVPAYFRINALRSQAPVVVNGASAVEGLSGVWRLDSAKKLGKLLTYAKSGEVVIQDLSTIVAGVVASPKPGDIVLDLCAAPGNKTSHLAALMNNRGKIISVDVSAKRMIQWKKEMNRLGCVISSPIISDATRLDLHAEADVVLVDPPCSNSGVFARNPSVKWKITPSRIHSFTIRQATILRSASEHVRTGGTLVYSTCSILPEENEDVISRFMRTNPEFKMEKQTPFLGSPGLKGFEGFQRFYTHLQNCNGYFIAKLRRIN
jgi:16S rRNA (cytosine967-C5)-methyltransferase